MIENKENIHFDVFANLFRGIESVGGKLKISDGSLLFTSHALNIQQGSTEIIIDQITSIKKRNTLGIVPNGMLITTRDGVEYKFVVWNRQRIIEFINKRLQSV
ncbi:MAG: GRAM domain-containing protein [Candidatus Pristimantibacillus lignocellulolyticus]|uniref:GRAM domain-containing protein n=1 Tax=Candidatus Pristimantibacillus lignocellulolyticus TaxID=2994561 RepID=A0A9J6ZCM3_9BACL|nr:MAG: GRAM domain-containing protein [Candidatus Pristimantibacillus lignocellulolyticus]